MENTKIPAWYPKITEEISALAKEKAKDEEIAKEDWIAIAIALTAELKITADTLSLGAAFVGFLLAVYKANLIVTGIKTTSAGDLVATFQSGNNVATVEMYKEGGIVTSLYTNNNKTESWEINVANQAETLEKINKHMNSFVM